MVAIQTNNIGVALIKTAANEGKAVNNVLKAMCDTLEDGSRLIHRTQAWALHKAMERGIYSHLQSVVLSYDRV